MIEYTDGYRMRLDCDHQASPNKIVGDCVIQPTDVVLIIIQKYC